VFHAQLRQFLAEGLDFLWCQWVLDV
jgi:hypothetical protein